MMQYKGRINLIKIGRELKRRRANSGLSQEKVALGSDMVPYLYGRLENGLIDDIKIQTLDKVAGFYNMTLEELLGYGSTNIQEY